ncbi:hypothetical protein TPA0908_00270 [Micromonospora sp. AKA38]|nr:hypothetical protein TPA0908_00270 [Micromonospora sp. AKA38]
MAFRTVTSGSSPAAPTVGVRSPAPVHPPAPAGRRAIGMGGVHPARPIRPVGRPGPAPVAGTGRPGAPPDATFRAIRHTPITVTSLCVLRSGTTGDRTGEPA